MVVPALSVIRPSVEAYVALPRSTLMCVKDVQPSKRVIVCVSSFTASSVKRAGNIMFFKPIQFWNAPSPITRLSVPPSTKVIF